SSKGRSGSCAIPMTGRRFSMRFVLTWVAPSDGGRKRKPSNVRAMRRFSISKDACWRVPHREAWTNWNTRPTAAYCSWNIKTIETLVRHYYIVRASAVLQDRHESHTKNEHPAVCSGHRE